MSHLWVGKSSNVIYFMCSLIFYLQAWNKKHHQDMSHQFSSVQSLSCVQLFATPWTIARQTPLSMGFSRQELEWIAIPFSRLQFSSVQSLSRVQLFATPWITAPQVSLSITNSQSLPKLMSIELVMPSNHLIFNISDCSLWYACLWQSRQPFSCL